MFGVFAFEEAGCPGGLAKMGDAAPRAAEYEHQHIVKTDALCRVASAARILSRRLSRKHAEPQRRATR